MGKRQRIKILCDWGGLKDNDSLYQYKKKFFRFDEDLRFFTGRKILDLEAYKYLVGLSSPDFPVDDISADSVEEGYFPKYRMP